MSLLWASHITGFSHQNKKLAWKLSRRSSNQSKLRIFSFLVWYTANIMSFVKEYTHLFPEGIWNCLFPEGPKALKEISFYRFLKEINCIFLIKTHDIRFIIYFYAFKALKNIYFDKKWSLAFVYIRRGFPSCDVIMMSFWGFPLKTHDKQWVYHESRW